MKKLLQVKVYQSIGLVLLLMALGSEIFAATKTWQGGTMGSENDWNTAGNWSASGVPGNNDDVIIPNGLSNYPVLSGAANSNVSTITINSGGSLTINTGGSLTVRNDLIVSGSNGLSVTDGSLTVNKALQVDNGTALSPSANISGGTVSCKDLQGDGFISMSDGTLEISRDFNLTTPTNFSATGGTVKFTGATGPNPFPAGTYNFFNVEIDMAGEPNFGSNMNTFNIAGSFTNNGTATFTNTTVNFNGTMAQSIGGTATTTFATLNISSNVSVTTDISITNLSVSAGNTLTISSGTTTISNSASISGAVDITSGATFSLSADSEVKSFLIDEVAQPDGVYCSVGQGCAAPPTNGTETSLLSGTGTLTVNSLLPVELTHFKAYVESGKTHLEWSTASELDNEKFLIERSGDGKSFYSIGEMKGRGTTSLQQDYHFMDDKPFVGINYYRLKQIDFDDTYAYSDVIAVNINNKTEAPTYLVAPNPVINRQFDLITNKILLEKPLLFLSNSLGQTIPLEAAESGTGYRVNLPANLPAGAYQLHITTGKERTFKTIIVQ